jgi:hypothetical protein
MTITPPLLRTYGHAGFRVFSIFDVEFEYLFDNLRHTRKTSLFMFARELLLWFRERIGALIGRATIERHAIEHHTRLYSGGKKLMCINFRLEEAFSGSTTSCRWAGFM